MTVAISDPAVTQDVTFTVDNGQCGCGLQTVTWSPAYTFLSVSTTMPNILSLYTIDQAHEGTWPVTMTVSLASYPAITPITKNFDVIITCGVISIVFDATTPATQILNIGVDSQPMSIPFSITKVLPCPQPATFTLSPTLGFVTLSPSGDGGTIIVDNVVMADVGIYALVLTASQYAVTTTHNLSLDLRNPCKTATTVTIPDPLITMNIVVPDTGTEPQTYTITTDVTQSNGVICNFNAVLTPAANYISLSGDFLTITVDKANVLLPTDLGTHPFSIAIDSLEFSATVTTKTLNFNVVI